MASIFLRGSTYWLKYTDPQTRKSDRVSLKTADLTTAELLKEKAEAELFLRKPHIMALELPICLGGSALSRPSIGGALSVVAEKFTVSVVMEQYRDFVQAENVAKHAATKLARFERFFGSTIMGTDKKIPGVFKGRYFSEISIAAVEKFINGLRDNRKTGSGKLISEKTKLGYREAFHHLFEFAIKRGYFVPTNIRYPNPMSALPNWRGKPKPITYLSPESIRQLLEDLKFDPKLRAAVAIMIFGGLRRSEMLALQWRNISLEDSRIGVTYVADPLDIEGVEAVNSLKTTGSMRSVPIFSELQPILSEYRAVANSDWVIPSPQGFFWDCDHFSANHRKMLKQIGERHTCLDYRHTFATLLAKHGYSLYQISQLMGNSPAICEKHYAAFVLPDHAMSGKSLLR